MQFLKTSPRLRGVAWVCSPAAGFLHHPPPQDTGAGPAPPHTDVGFPRAPGAVLGKAKPAMVLSQLCREHHPPAGASPAPRIIPRVVALMGWEALHPPLCLSLVGRIPGK